MPLVIGTDEAGYAPNLGPLVVCATAWQVPRTDFDFYTELADQVRSDVALDDWRLVVADSKSAYHSGGSIDRLELAALSLLATCTPRPRGIAELVNSLSESQAVIPAHYEWGNDRLPQVADDREVDRCHTSLVAGFRDKQVALRRIAARLVFPDEFNQLVDALGNKATVLSAITLGLVRELLNRLDGDGVIVCDRHGGRARYAPLVQHYLTEQWPRVIEETPHRSRYSWSEATRELEIQFQVKGESFFPTAAASMIAKYLRELMMFGWNGFWQRRDSALRPTAGYPGDAKRFLRDVRPIMQRMGIGDEAIWRNR